MRKFMFPLLLLLLAIFAIPTHADPLAKEVEVVNSSDNAVPVQGSVDVTNTPLDVNLVQESQSYEYVVLRYENLDAGQATASFQSGLNSYASDGWEFVSWWHFVPVADSGGVGKWLYIAIMRRPMY
jgi:hypothetical protein